MLSIHNVSCKGADHYYEVKDEYYMTEKAGQWWGIGAEKLGLSGDVFKRDFNRLLAGRSSKNRKLVNVGGKKRKHRAGIDLTFSAPKSVTIAAEVLGDRRIHDMHEKAVKVALTYVERYVVQARITENGETTKKNTRKLIAALFQHHTSRELDPQLHTHCVLMNMTYCPDKKWRAISNESIYDAKMLAGQIYRNAFAIGLKEIGYGILKKEKGLFELAGMPEELMEEFSKRAKQMEALIDKLQKQHPHKKRSEIKAIAAQRTRKAKKKNIDMKKLKQEWTDTTQKYGYKPQKLLKKMQSYSKEIGPKRENSVNKALAILTETQSFVTKNKLLQNALALALGHKDIDIVLAEFKRSTHLCAVDKKRQLYTSKEIIWREREIIQEIKQSRRTVEAITTRQKIGKIKNVETLTRGQRDALEHILTTTDRFIGIQGDAGTGKTYMLGFAKNELEKNGYTVRGLSVTGKAVDEMEKIDLKSETIDRFLLRNRSVTGNADKTIYIIDEASMLGSWKCHTLLKHIEPEARIVFIGDKKQLQAIDAGSIFKTLQSIKAISMVRMKEAKRFESKHMIEAARHIADAKMEEAFNTLDKNRCIYQEKDIDKQLKKAAGYYVKAISAKEKPIVVTKSNQEKDTINALVKEQLIKSKKVNEKSFTFKTRQTKNVMGIEKNCADSYKVGDHFFLSKAVSDMKAGTAGEIIKIDRMTNRITVAVGDEVKRVSLDQYGQHFSLYQECERSFSKGDRIYLGKNDSKLKVKNGQFGEIQHVDRKGNFTVKLESGRKLMFNIREYSYLDYGYAITDYCSQGASVDQVIFVANNENFLNYNSFYVAVSRAKKSVQILTNDKKALKSRIKIEQENLTITDYIQARQTETKSQSKGRLKQWYFGLEQSLGL